MTDKVNDKLFVTPVIQSCVIDVLYEKKRQEIVISGCVLDFSINSFYGPYVLTDEKNRVLGRSNNGTISFRRNDLQTEEVKVWYDSIASFSDQYKQLKTYVNEPGLCFSHIPKVYLQFEDAPDVNVEPKRVFNHIHAIYTVNNLWHDKKKILRFN